MKTQTERHPSTQTERHPSIPVTVETIIGEIGIGEGEHSIPEAAFLMMAQYSDRNNWEGPLTFRFPGPDEGQTITVTVNTEKE